jgi:2-polyprenyl-6-methoxyphenol hydroxylase-like FAD-dependent oxidoreductase
MYRDLGILPEAERRGVAVHALSYHLGPRRTLRLPLAAEMSPLILPQEDTDDLLGAELARLGGSVEWGLTLTKLAAAGDEVSVELRRADGTPERRAADWLIGADGVHSTTRAQLGIEFPGVRIPITYLLAEGRIRGDHDREAINYFIGRAGGALLAPLPGGRVRISAPLPDGTEVTDDTAQQVLDAQVPGRLHVLELSVNTTFTSHESHGLLHDRPHLLQLRLKFIVVFVLVVVIVVRVQEGREGALELTAGVAISLADAGFDARAIHLPGLIPFSEREDDVTSV